MNIVDPAVESYMAGLASVDDEPVLIEMEERAAAQDFPIIGRLCGRTLELLARSIGAQRIFELGSGFGYSAYWFSRATGPHGEIHLTDMDPANERRALGYLGRAGLADPIQYHVSDALEALEATGGEFDIVYCDIDKLGYPRAWDVGRTRVRVGGFYISDNMLWSGRVAEADKDDTTKAIDATNRAIEADPNFRSTIIPTRDGVAVALRIS